MCACLREIALVVRPVFLNQRQAVKTQEVLVWQISARDGKMRSICQKHIRTSKQPEINARLKIKVYIYILYAQDVPAIDVEVISYADVKRKRALDG